MDKRIVPALAAFLLAAPAAAETIESAYTDLDIKRDCSMFDESDEGDGAASFACNGYLGYPVLIYSGDLRDSLFFGFPPGEAPKWESFDGFNAAGPKIEWRVLVNGEKRIPFATIHRWSVSTDPEDPDVKTEVLVVEKVGQVDHREGCAVGYVVATGNAKANETARKIADEQVRGFTCGADEPVQVEGSVGVPPFSRE
ncbi:MAG: hypothetical protein J0H34_08480 [Rhizobiales bacterium]|nr:hypothetical protein [Hyphomicrobiales bacterium]